MPRPCSICNHSKRAEIDAALIAEEPFRNIAARFGTTIASLHRHREAHGPRIEGLNAVKAPAVSREKAEPRAAEPGPKLTVKQQLFIEAYLGKANGNGTEAARLAGYRGNDRTLTSMGVANVANPLIAAGIRAGLQQLKSIMGREEVLTRLSDHGRGSLEDFISVKDGRATLDLAAAKAAGKLHLLKSFTETAEGIRIQLHDPQAALAKLGQFHRLFVDRTEHSGPDGGPMEVRATSDAALQAVRHALERQLATGISLTDARRSLLTLGVDEEDLDAVYRELELEEEDRAAVPAR